jgi:GcrA cell cycle regulator
MKQHIPDRFSNRLIDWSPFVIMGNTMPPRDPDEDEDDDDEEEEEEDNTNEPPVVREPDED